MKTCVVISGTDVRAHRGVFLQPSVAFLELAAHRIARREDARAGGEGAFLPSQVLCVLDTFVPLFHLLVRECEVVPGRPVVGKVLCRFLIGNYTLDLTCPSIRTIIYLPDEPYSVMKFSRKVRRP